MTDLLDLIAEAEGVPAASTPACRCWDRATGPWSWHEGHCCLDDYPAEPYDGPLLCGHDQDERVRAACAAPNPATQVATDEAANVAAKEAGA